MLTVQRTKVTLHGLCLLLLFVLPACGDDDAEDPGPPADFSGNWAGDFASDRVNLEGTVLATIQQQDTAVSGMLSLTASPCISSATLTGSVAGQRASLTATSTTAASEVIEINGDLSGDSFEGRYEVPSGTCAGDSGSIILVRP